MAGYVSLQDVTKTYKMGEVTIKAADGISFDVEKGEFVIVVGPSGAGKTTVLNILGGMDTATSGKVLVDGAEISKYRGKKLIQYRREDIGFVFQFYNLIPTLTVRKNILMPLLLDKRKPNQEYFQQDSSCTAYFKPGLGVHLVMPLSCFLEVSIIPHIPVRFYGFR